MRGAPQVGFSAAIRKIRARPSLLTCLRPPARLALETHVQYKRNPARCQLTTVLGVTKTRGFVHPDQNVFNATATNMVGCLKWQSGKVDGAHILCILSIHTCFIVSRFPKPISVRCTSRSWSKLNNALLSVTGSKARRFPPFDNWPLIFR